MMPHYYHTIQGWFTQESLFTRMVYSCNENRKYHFVEIGSWKGKSSTFMAVEIANSELDIQFDCVDTWEGSEEHIHKNSFAYEPLLEMKDGLYQEFLKNIEPVKSYINPIRMKSVEASKLYENESLDFVFIDGAHDYQSVKEDIEHWFPKVKRGGYIAGDDYNWETVKLAVIEFFGNDILIPSTGPNKEMNTWMNIKK
jgi:hypothetical protein